LGGIDPGEFNMPDTKHASWGRLEKRYNGDPQPLKLLALDGGGIRGVLTLQVLIRMEELLAEKSGQGVAQLDSVAHIDDLIRVGQALAKEMKLEHFCLDRFGQFY
jgi:hypothetical protein